MASRINETTQLFQEKEKLVNLIKMGKTHFFLIAFFSFAYASLAPNIFHQDWDSLMYAYWSEVNGIRSIWGNHPLGHVILNSVYAMILNLGYHGKALPIFIICNSIFGGVAVALFFSLMKIIKNDYLSSLGYAIIFGASYGIWHYSGSADLYSLSILFLLLAWIFLLYEVQAHKAHYLYISGGLAGLSVLSHQLNAVFFLVALIVIYFQNNDRWASIITFYSASFATILLGAITLGFIATSSFSISVIYDWFRGYLGDSIYGNSLSLESIQVSFKTALGTVLVTTSGKARFIRITIYIFFIGAILIGLTQVKRLHQDQKVVLLSAFIQCFVSWLLIAWFESWYPKFWLLVLVPGMILLACCILALEMGFALQFQKFRNYTKYYSSLPVILGLIFVVFNMRYAILNEHIPDEISQESLDIWLEHSKQGDMLITAGDLIPQLWFWSNRPNTIHLYHYLVVSRYSNDRFEYLEDQIDQFLCDGNSVVLAPAIVDNFGDSFLLWLDLTRDDLQTFFDRYQREIYFTYTDLNNREETRVYKLINPNACDK
jgi:hypothetical protein